MLTEIKSKITSLKIILFQLVAKTAISFSFSLIWRTKITEIKTSQTYSSKNKNKTY